MDATLWERLVKKIVGGEICIIVFGAWTPMLIGFYVLQCVTLSVPSNFHSSVRPPPIHLFFLRPSVKIKKIMKNNQGRISLPVGPRAKICQSALALCQADGYSIHKILLKIMNSGA